MAWSERVREAMAEMAEAAVAAEVKARVGVSMPRPRHVMQFGEWRESADLASLRISALPGDSRGCDYQARWDPPVNGRIVSIESPVRVTRAFCGPVIWLETFSPGARLDWSLQVNWPVYAGTRVLLLSPDRSPVRALVVFEAGE